MAARLRPHATYADLLRAPDDRIAEIVDGELYTSPRPGGAHSRFTTVLTMDLGPAYDRRVNGPGGWVFYFEPELHLGTDDVLVPDLAGWRRERLPQVPKSHIFPVAPDWICEVLSPSTRRLDLTKKLPVYAREGVSHAWLIDPLERTVEIRRLQNQQWLVIATYAGNDKFRAEPFELVEIDLPSIWGEDEN